VGPESRVFLWHKFYSLCGSIFIFIIQIMKVLETSEGLAISYRDSEKGEGPVIFIHGFPFDKSSWEPQFRFLKDKYRVITYDLPGFGWSSPLSGQPDLASGRRWSAGFRWAVTFCWQPLHSTLSVCRP
jgi:pimeloyl-ACP methyl ester carboxylesterase